MIIKKVFISDIIKFFGDDLESIFGFPKEDMFIDNLADFSHITATSLDWINPSRSDKQMIAEQSKAKVLLVDKYISYSDVLIQQGKILLVVKNPKLALAKVGNHFFVEKLKPGIHPTAIVSKGAEIADTVTIGAYAVIGKAKIGDGTVVSPFVRIYDNVTIGRECFIKEGAVIGGAGFGFERDEEGNRFRFPQIGGVRIGDHVDIGGNTCIDRGALSDTILDDYAKVDNLCHIAHNAHIGKNAVVVACAEVSGSCTIGEDTWVGPNACIRDQRNVGSNTMIGMGAVVVKHVGDNEVWAGNPAKEMTKK